MLFHHENFSDISPTVRIPLSPRPIQKVAETVLVHDTISPSSVVPQRQCRGPYFFVQDLKIFVLLTKIEFFRKFLKYFTMALAQVT